MEQLVSDILTNYGPLAIGWVAAGVLGWMVLSEKKKNPYQKVTDAYHTAIVDNTRAMERLATIIEERTRRR